MKFAKYLTTVIMVLSMFVNFGCQTIEKNTVIKKSGANHDYPIDNDLDWQDIYLDNILSVAKVDIYQCIHWINQADASCSHYGHGSGFVVADNVLATNWHVAEYYSNVNLYDLPDKITYYKIFVRYPAHQTLNNNEFLIDSYEVTGVYSGLKGYDLALMKVNTLNRQPVKFTGDRWEDGEILTPVMAMGYPLNFEFVATTGTITDILVNDDYSIYWAWPETKYFKTDAQIDGGNSGGPLFNKKGEVMGVNFATLNSWTTTHFFALATDYFGKVNLDNLNFEIREIPDPNNYIPIKLFSVKGELNPVYETENIANFPVTEGCIYKLTASGDDFADDGTPQTPAITVLYLALSNGTGLGQYPNWDNPILTNLNYVPNFTGTASLFIYMDTYYQPNPGWYEAWGWEWCPAE